MSNKTKTYYFHSEMINNEKLMKLRNRDLQFSNCYYVKLVFANAKMKYASTSLWYLKRRSEQWWRRVVLTLGKWKDSGGNLKCDSSSFPHQYFFSRSFMFNIYFYGSLDKLGSSAWNWIYITKLHKHFYCPPRTWNASVNMPGTL